MTEIGGVPVEIVRHPTARRVKLAIDPVTGCARLTVPRRAVVKSAVAWAQSKAGWLAEQRARLTPARPFAVGTTLTVADQMLTIDWSPGTRRRVEIVGGSAVAIGT